MTEATPFLPGLSPLRRKPLTAAQDAGNLSSNGGLIVLRESALRSGVAAVVADAVPDRRCQLLVTHSYRAMVTARMMAIAAGYEDADDLDALRFDPALMLACNREPEGGHPLRQDRMLTLAGQPVPPVPAHGGLLALALGAARRTQEVVLARRHVPDHTLNVREARMPRRGAQEQDQAVVLNPPAAC
jgi:DDE family transposase